MFKHRFLLICFLAAAGINASEHKAHWGYIGDTGPTQWAKLSSDYATCSGKNQSPVNITNTLSVTLPPIVFDYKQTANKMFNNGHSVQLNFPKGNAIVVENRPFALQQMHFHSPSEHQINGKHYPMEIHFVHADDHGNLAVVGVMVEEGKANPGLINAFSRLPIPPDETLDIANLAQPDLIIPVSNAYVRINGSLTTPPCSEGVRWYVMKAPVTASRQQIMAFKQSMHGPNNRPVQPLNARIIVE